MNESADLRKRILKMRENNDNILSSVKPEDVIIGNKKKLDHSNKNIILSDDKKTIKTPSLKNTLSSHSQAESSSFNQNINNNLKDTNEAQFRILANKFNEAVEVILELSDKVKKLEQLAFKELNDMNNENILKKRNSFFYYINIKIVCSIILIFLLVLGIFTLPFDFETLHLILYEIITTL